MTHAVLHPDGRVIDERYADRVAVGGRVSLCTGCDLPDVPSDLPRRVGC